MQSSSMVKNLGQGVIKKLKKISSNPYKQLGIDWLSLRKLKNQPAGKLYKQKFLNGEAFFYDSEEFLYGLKDIFLNEIYDIQLPSNARIIDCGGHIGLSVIYLKHHHPDAKIIVFEPDEKNYDLLVKNIHSQGYNDVDVRKEGVWKEETTLTFFSEGSMSSRIDNKGRENSTIIKAVRLKDFLNEKIDFLKLDIEGAEYEVLKDIRDKFYNIENLFIEYHGSFAHQPQLVEILTWAAQAGFTFYIKEAHNVYPQPFNEKRRNQSQFDIQLNIFCFKNR